MKQLTQCVVNGSFVVVNGSFVVVNGSFVVVAFAYSRVPLMRELQPTCTIVDSCVF